MHTTPLPTLLLILAIGIGTPITATEIEGPICCPAPELPEGEHVHGKLTAKLDTGRFSRVDETGPATWLAVRFRFKDDEKGPPSVDTAAVVDLFTASSGGRRSITATEPSSVIELAWTRQEYIDDVAPEHYLTSVRNALADDHGLNYQDFDYVSYITQRGSPFITHNGGAASVGGQTSWLTNGSDSVVAHELGHNHGLGHSGLWQPSDSSATIGNGKSSEYGNHFCFMGHGKRDFSALTKWYLNFLTADQIPIVTESGRHTLHAHDQGGYESGRAYGLVLDPELDLFADGDSRPETYFLSFRQSAKRDPINLGATLIGFEFPRLGQLLDTTPGSEAGRDDATIRVGRTYEDRINEIYITSLARRGEGNEATLDVQIEIGPFPDNEAPTAVIDGPTTVRVGETASFTCTASDPDGDDLAHFWASEVASDPANAPSFNRSWSSEGVHTLTCVVSDMKGGSIEVSHVVTVEDPEPVTRLIKISVVGISGTYTVHEASGAALVSETGSSSWDVSKTGTSGTSDDVLLGFAAMFEVLHVAQARPSDR